MARAPTGAEIWNVWKAYCLPLIPTVPVIGDPWEADCIWTQAFSRIQYPEKDLVRTLTDLSGTVEDGRCLHLPPSTECISTCVLVDSAEGIESRYKAAA